MELGSQSRLVHTSGSWDGTPQLEVPLATDRTQLGAISLCGRRGDRRYIRQEQDALAGVAQIVAEAIQQDRLSPGLAADPSDVSPIHPPR